MSKIVDFVEKHMDAFIIGSAIISVAGMVVGASMYNKEKERKHIESLPDAYWDAKAREAEANATKRIELAKIEAEAQTQMAKEEYEAMKSMPDSYFQMKTAEIMRDASVKAAKIEANARTEAVREQTRALNNTVDTLAQTMKENK